jgi:type IV pilus assembly protein PilB
MSLSLQVQKAILQWLVENGALAAEKASSVQQMVSQGNSLHELLVEGNLVDEEQYTQAYAAAMGLPYVKLRDVTIPKDVLHVIPESTARGHMIIAYEQTTAALKVAMANPADRQIVEFIHKKVDMPVEVSLASASSILSLGRVRPAIRPRTTSTNGTFIGDRATKAATIASTM